MDTITEMLEGMTAGCGGYIFETWVDGEWGKNRGVSAPLLIEMVRGMTTAQQTMYFQTKNINRRLTDAEEADRRFVQKSTSPAEDGSWDATVGDVSHA